MEDISYYVRSYVSFIKEEEPYLFAFKNEIWKKIKSLTFKKNNSL